MEWSKKVKELRNKLCITQTELAEMLGVAFISVNRYENGKSIPTMKIKRKIKEILLKNDIKEE